jgi:hypothetical protein
VSNATDRGRRAASLPAWDAVIRATWCSGAPLDLAAARREESVASDRIVVSMVGQGAERDSTPGLVVTEIICPKREA